MTETDWPVTLRGVTESIVATLGPNELYNFAALGLHTPDVSERGHDESADVTARTWGRTRTWRNFSERGEGVVQFSRDPVLFVEAALGIYEAEEAIHDSADAWVRVSVERVAEGTDAGTRWVDWRLIPEESARRREVVPTFNRAYGAVVEATVAASRLDVDAYETGVLLERIEYFEGVAERCGGERERVAFERLREHLPENPL